MNASELTSKSNGKIGSHHIYTIHKRNKKLDKEQNVQNIFLRKINTNEKETEKIEDGYVDRPRL